MRAHVLGWVLAVALVAVPPLVGAPEVAAQDAAPPGAPPPWLRAIQDGIATQDAELARSGPKAVVVKAANKAGRQGDVVTLYLLARAYGKAEQFADAIATYGDVLKGEPALWLAWRDRGVLRWKGNDVAGAEADLRQAVAILPRYVDALLPLGMMLLEAKRYDDGIRTLQRVLDVDATRDDARFQIVLAYGAMGKVPEALGALEPLLGKAPRDPRLLHEKAVLLLGKGDAAGAQATFKQIAVLYPDRREPLLGWLSIAAKQKTIDQPDDALWVFERLRRLTKDPEERKRIDVQVDALRRQLAAPKDAPAAPAEITPALVAQQLRAPDAEARRRALLFVLLGARETFKIEGDLLRAIVERASPTYESFAPARALAVAVFEKYADPQLAPIVRVVMRDDPDGRVRSKAADALAAMGNVLAVAALAPFATGSDEELATAARNAIYTLAKTSAPVADEAAAAQADAFRTWWAGVEARDVKLRAVDALLASHDRFVWEPLYELARDADDAVWPAAYRGLARVAAAARGATDPMAVWMAKLPAFDDAALVAARRAEVAAALAAWWGGKPR